MRSAVARHALVVLNGIWPLRRDVLNQGSTAGYIENLNSKTDREERHRPLFYLLKDQQIRLVFNLVYIPESGMWLATVPKRINVGDTNRQQNAVEISHDLVNEICVRDQREL